MTTVFPIARALASKEQDACVFVCVCDIRLGISPSSRTVVTCGCGAIQLLRDISRRMCTTQTVVALEPDSANFSVYWYYFFHQKTSPRVVGDVGVCTHYVLRYAMCVICRNLHGAGIKASRVACARIFAIVINVITRAARAPSALLAQCPTLSFAQKTNTHS